MGRLTVRNFENEACCTHGGCDAYEDCYECPGFQDILAKLAHYEDLEEAGRLVELPCKVGDTVWFIRPLASKKEITETTVEKMVVKGKGLFMKLACNAMYETSCNSIGKTVFLTRGEAEAALKGAE